MVYTPLIHKAIELAIKIHELDVKKKRKGTDIPYITHPLTVGLILARVTTDENIIAAGILHDTVEDCEPYGSVTEESLTKDFNHEVSRMVDDVTEQDKTLPWKDRKAAAFAHIKDMKQDSLLVKSADVLHNLISLNDDVAKQGNAVFSKFNAGKADTITRYQRLVPELKNAWPNNPLHGDLEAGLNKLLELTK